MNTEKLRAMLAAASPAPWEHVHICDGDEVLRFGEQVSFEDKERNGGAIEQEADAALIVAMRGCFEELLDVVEVAEKLIDKENLRGSQLPLKDCLVALSKKLEAL